MFFKLCILFIVTPLVDLMLLLKAGAHLGVGTTVFIVILTGVVGAALARKEGSAAWTRVRNTLNSGKFPTDDLMDGVMIFAAGILLMTPGFLTDIAGFSLLAPFCRSLFRKELKGRFKGKMHFHAKTTFGGQPQNHSPSSPDDVIDVEAKEVSDKKLNRE